MGPMLPNPVSLGVLGRGYSKPASTPATTPGFCQGWRTSWSRTVQHASPAVPDGPPRSLFILGAAVSPPRLPGQPPQYLRFRSQFALSGPVPNSSSNPATRSSRPMLVQASRAASMWPALLIIASRKPGQPAVGPADRVRLRDTLIQRQRLLVTRPRFLVVRARQRDVVLERETGFEPATSTLASRSSSGPAPGERFRTQ